jgi:predicted MFS family arabinose efflux permease
MKSQSTDYQQYHQLVVILGIAGFISAADNWFVAPILPAIAAGFGTSVVKCSAIITAYLIPYGAMQPIYGFFSDRHRKVNTLRLIVGGLAIGTAGCALSQSLIQLCIFRFTTGFFAAGIIAVSLAIIGDTVPETLRQCYVGRFMGIVFLGQGLSTGLGGFCAGLLNWRMAFCFFCMAAISITIFLHRLFDTVSAASKNGKFVPILKLIVTSQKGRIIFPLALVVGCLLLGVYSYIGSYLHERFGLGYLQTGLIMMFYGLACMAAGTWVGKFSRKNGSRGALLTGGCFGLGATLLLAFFPWWQTGLLAIICLGLGYIFIQSTLATLAFEVSSQRKGLSSGLIGLGLFCGGGIGTALGSWVLSYAGYRNLWLVLGGGIGMFVLYVLKMDNSIQ